MRKEVMVILMSICAFGLVGFFKLDMLLTSAKMVMRYMSEMQSVNITLRIMGQAQFQVFFIELEMLRTFLFGKKVKGCF